MSFENVQRNDCRSHRLVQSTCKLQKTCVFHAEPTRKDERELTRLVRQTTQFRQNCQICEADIFGGGRVVERLSSCGGGICSRGCVSLMPVAPALLEVNATAVGADSRCRGVPRDRAPSHRPDAQPAHAWFAPLGAHQSFSSVLRTAAEHPDDTRTSWPDRGASRAIRNVAHTVRTNCGRPENVRDRRIDRQSILGADTRTLDGASLSVGASSGGRRDSTGVAGVRGIDRTRARARDRVHRRRGLQSAGAIARGWRCTVRLRRQL